MPRPTQPHARIALIRHARSSHTHSGWTDASGFRAWREAYEAAGIHEDERVPDGFAQLLRDADLVISSDAARAVASARILVPGRDIVISPLLRELDLEAPSLGPLRLPLRAWAVAVGARTLYRSLRRRYPSAAEAARIDRAAVWLQELSADHSMIIVVTHAMFRGRLATSLLQNGWEAEPGRRTLRHWSAWSFKRSS